MKRDLIRMNQKVYDLIVIGGGISGAAVAWDASLRGLSVALLEKDDFASATSSATSKLIHGGLRYLKNLEFGLVRESLRERRIMEIITPHFVFPMPFIGLIYGRGSDKGLIKIGLTLYDLLAFDRKNLNDPDKIIPDHRMLSREEIVRLVPNVDTNNLESGAVFYDCLVHNPERHTLEFILSAAERGADIANYAAVIDIIKEENAVTGVKVRDRNSGKEYQIRARVTVNVTGPWGDITLGMLHKGIEAKLVRSKGIHMVTRSLTKDYGVAMMTKTKRGRVSIMPWREHSLIGITDRVYAGEPDHFKVSEEDIRGLIEDVNDNFPAANLQRSDILYFYGGLRPIIEKETVVDVYDSSRKYEIYDHEKDDGIKNIITGIGGKYTTSRNLARKIVNLVCKKLGGEFPPCRTENTPTIGGATGVFREYLEREWIRHDGKYPREVFDNLVYHYGTVYNSVLGIVHGNDTLKRRIVDGRPDILAQVVYAVREEMALHLDDVLFRRTGAGTLGHPGDEALRSCADIMSELLGWSEEEKEAEISWALTYYTAIARDEDMPPSKFVLK